MNIDPLTATNTFATIVQLLGMFKQERKDSQNAGHQEFVEWLQYHRHEDVKNLICNTAAIQADVAKLLLQDTATILSKLDAMNGILATLLSRVNGFQGLSRSLVPNAELSGQAISMLRQCVNSNSKKFIYQDLGHGVAFQPEDGEPFAYTEPRFLSDDLDSLERCGFITLRSVGNHGLKIYGITRAGVRYIETIGKTNSNEPI